MKYFKKFRTESEVIVFNTPNVILITDTKKVLYNVPLTQGVYIQHINGSLYTTENWSAGGYSNDEANGIAVLDSDKSFVVAKSGIHFSNTWASGYYSSVLIEGIVTTTNRDAAIQDYSGNQNTKNIKEAISSEAINAALNYRFPCGEKGYLPALGELFILYKYKDAFNVVAASLNGNTLANEYWSSTQATASMAWRLKGGEYYAYEKTTNSYVRPFMPLSLG